MEIIQCPECKAEVVECDNNVYLDYPAVPYDEYKAQWTIMSFSTTRLASAGNPGLGGMGHSLHEHQPSESVMSQ